MRRYSDLMDLHPSIIGSMSVIGSTVIGAPVDTLGFADVLAVLIAGQLMGTGDGTANVTLAVKVQESASITGTGALWTDITDGAIHVGSFDFDSINFANTSPVLSMAKEYEHLAIGRKRYIRAHATLSGTVGVGPKLCVAFLLGRPNDTLYVAGAITQATANTQYTLLK
jgi:hypothetical protein